MTIQNAIEKCEENYSKALANDNLLEAQMWQHYKQQLELIRQILQDMAGGR